MVKVIGVKESEHPERITELKEQGPQRELYRVSAFERVHRWGRISKGNKEGMVREKGEIGAAFSFIVQGSLYE